MGTPGDARLLFIDVFNISTFSVSTYCPCVAYVRLTTLVGTSLLTLTGVLGLNVDYDDTFPSSKTLIIEVFLLIMLSTFIFNCEPFYI
jgi:hypothetical protein